MKIGAKFRRLPMDSPKNESQKSKYNYNKKSPHTTNTSCTFPIIKFFILKHSISWTKRRRYKFARDIEIQRLAPPAAASPHRNMAMQTGVATSKVLILVGAGLTGSVILKSGRLSDLILQLQEVINGVNAAETSPGKYDTALLAAQIRQLAQEIREMSISNPITIFNKDSSSSGCYGSYILPAAAVGAMGYCYMKWKGWSFSDVMYVTKHNMANAVASVSKQLENVSDALASTRRHLTKRLENLDWKLDEQIEISNLITNDVRDVKANLNQIGFDINLIHEMVSGLEGKIELLESNQDVTNSGLWYLCQAAGGIKDVQNTKVIQGIEAKLIEHSKVTPKENSVKGLEFIVESSESSVPPKSVTDTEGKDIIDNFTKGPVASKMRIHRSYPVGLSLTRSVLGPGF